MTIREFEDKYYLHDSNIEKISLDAEKKFSRSKFSSVSGCKIGTIKTSCQMA